MSQENEKVTGKRRVFEVRDSELVLERSQVQIPRWILKKFGGKSDTLSNF